MRETTNVRRRAAATAAAVLTAGLIAHAAQAQGVDYGIDLPDKVPGFYFPTPETVINHWLDGEHDESIYQHGWGIWAGLTADSGTTARGVPHAPVYLTWLDPSEIVKATRRGGSLGAADKKLTLQVPRQFHGASSRVSNLAALKGPSCGGGGTPDTCITVTVNYSPAAAKHALTNALMLQSTLENYVEQGYTEIPNFPVDAITVKPVYKVISSKKLTENGLYVMPAWPGTPEPAKTFPPEDWHQCVYVDPGSGGGGNGNVDPTCKNPTPSNTYNISDFIHFKVTKADLAAFEALGGGQEPLAVGDIIVLVGMHVTTREIERWTWQTFWWTADPGNPNAPSSDAIAGAQPGEIDGAAGHYAMAIAYQMLDPAQPLNNGENFGALMPVYNPHLEAGFDPATFALSRVVVTPEGPVATQYGVETNCMTCHGLAMFDPAKDYDDDGALREKPYAANFYLARDDRVFDGKLQLDFAWSILGAMDTSR